MLVLSEMYVALVVRPKYAHLCKKSGPYRFDLLDIGGFDKS